LFCAKITLFFRKSTLEATLFESSERVLNKNTKLVEKRYAQKHSKLKDFYEKWNKII